MMRTSARPRLCLDLRRRGLLAALGVAPLCVFMGIWRSPQAAVPGAAPEVRCLADGSGYLRARLRGALSADVNWPNAGLECEGGMRPDGHGIRVSFAGPLRAAGAAHRLRFIFGIEAAGEGRSGRALPANVTLFLEGERRIFSTRGDRQCTVDRLRQQPLGETGRRRDYRVAARGFCVGPATSLAGSERVLVSRFDFSGRIALYTDVSPAKSKSESTAARTADPARPGDRRRPVS
jgi:hypothetical protein